MIFKKEDIIKKTTSLFLGFLIIAIGISMCALSNIGLAPWDVLAEGLSKTFDIPFGRAGIYVGIGVIIISLFIKVYPGVGTILNIVFIGVFIDLIMPYIPAPQNMGIAIIMNVIGVILMSLGTVMYLYANIGAGPRDSMLLGLVNRLKVDTTFVKPTIEAIVLIMGFFLGGTFGIGTFISLFLMGYCMDIFFALFKMNPKETKQMNFMEQWNYLKEVKEYESSRS
ncbi:putative membrane protein YczE [Bacilli bacterium PM5-3]|nr:putative membrane protein YczE [Bacilli bacterium PM5-3]MDH6603786.1 putative membrane protein YczE [Bacilli bacterium PM5-9]